ncbi:MAG: hypothetical protein AVDCRST_MAG89-4546, partial [uncultured Gemmatimonadetes bacterium]
CARSARRISPGRIRIGQYSGQFATSAASPSSARLRSSAGSSWAQASARLVHRSPVSSAAADSIASLEMETLSLDVDRWCIMPRSRTGMTPG